ncbi:metallophosphoesterase [Oceaniovalibus guishaninsula JLT2003]|uniref:Metallophosphoesterase n=1 Tax=Oceaniovalibus guishaninsula JLT2003 TaxID=1231392 RepID=K2H9K3_9RHOB|nr:metallophosphoesterase [Oceaniovalibus guishaninsula]EKE43297.1 metallophosphoesterase [Oceaniovalibus guishaninsula JLT2003]
MQDGTAPGNRAGGGLSALWRRLTRRIAGGPALPRPGDPVCLIGDIHGRADLLLRMLALIEAQPGAAQARVVTLGDMIGRGPASDAVLALLRDRQQADPVRTICLMGNHERMLLDFLTSPDAHAGWPHAAGRQVLAAFGVAADGPEKTARALRAALPAGTEAWIAARPLWWQADGIAAIHAAADPRLPLPHQDEATLLWARPDRMRRPRPDGLWVVHGHTVVAAPQLSPGRVAVDTGAWKHGVLSAAWFDADGLRFLQATA